jgi:multiple sugar transport system permease protein
MTVKVKIAKPKGTTIKTALTTQPSSPPKRRWYLSDASYGFMLVSPLLLILGTVVFYPLAYAVWSSFQNFRLSRPDAIRFNGFDNYLWVLRDDQFHLALKNSLIYTFTAVPLELVFGLGIALALVTLPRGKTLARTLLTLPMMLAPVAMGLMWKFMYNDQLGIINHLIETLQIRERGLLWLTEPTLAFISLIIVEIWATTPFMVILLGAGLTTIPQELYEAARIDGARGWATFRHITLPLLQPIILVALLIRGMDAFRVFDLVFILTQGGPANKTDVLSYYAYRLNFVQLNVGRASAASIIMLIILLIAGLFLIRGMRKEAA